MTESLVDSPSQVRDGSSGRDAERTKAEIVDTAGRLFAARGYSAVRLLDIANDVGVTPALIIRYFISKRDLFELVARSHVAAPRADPREVSRSSERMLAFWRDPNRRVSALALIRSLDTDTGDMLAREIEERAGRRWRDALREEYDEPEARIRARLMVGLMMGTGLFSAGALLEPELELSEQESALMARLYSRAMETLWN